MKSALPVFLVMKDRKCLIIGGGEVARRKVETLLEYTQNLTVISPHVSKEIMRLKDEGRVTWLERGYSKGDLKGFDLVIAATDDQEVNRTAAQEACELGVLFNAVDVTHLCNFYSPAIVSKGDLHIAVSTCGKSPAFSKLAKRFIERKLSSLDERMISRVQDYRNELKKLYPDDLARRMQIMNSLVDGLDIEKDDLGSLERMIKKI